MPKHGFSLGYPTKLIKRVATSQGLPLRRGHGALPPFDADAGQPPTLSAQPSAAEGETRPLGTLAQEFKQVVCPWSSVRSYGVSYFVKLQDIFPHVFLFYH